MTNAEKIKIMNEDELAKFLVNGRNNICDNMEDCHSHDNCLDCLKKWLSEEIENE